MRSCYLYIHVLNPLTTEFFPPRQHIFMHSAHTTFVGTPLPQHSLLSGRTWWGPHTWRDPIPLMIFMTPHKPSNRRSKVDVSWIFAQHFPKLGPDLTDGTPYITNLQVFLRPWVGSMNIIRIKNSRVNESHKNKNKTPTTCEGGAAVPPPLSIPPPPLVRLAGEARRNLT